MAGLSRPLCYSQLFENVNESYHAHVLLTVLKGNGLNREGEGETGMQRHKAYILLKKDVTKA
jgi:hypothetical protein